MHARLEYNMFGSVRLSNEAEAWAHLGQLPARVTCLERQDFLPFHLLSDAGFEICCFVLLLREHPGERVYYYGKTGDRGRDIVWHHADGTVEFVQCKRYTDNVGVDDVRKELAKLCVNVFQGRLPDKPDRVSFYVVPDLSSGAQDLLASQEEWRAVAPKALEEHLKGPPPEVLLAFAREWWPKFDRVAGAALGARVERHPTLMDRFFAVKKVVEGSGQDLQNIQEQLRALAAGLASVSPQFTAGEVPGTQGQSFTGAQQLVGRAQARRWEELARRALDVQTQRLWEEIRGEIRGLNNVRALDAGRQLREWLTGDGSDASRVWRGRACVLLADLAVIGSAVRSLYERIDVADAREWQTRALAEFGECPSPEDASRLAYLDARLTWIEGRADEAIDTLDAANDPNCNSLKLAILLDRERDAEAVGVARALPLDDRWCDRVVLAFSHSALADEIETVLVWARGRPDPMVYQRCLLAGAQGAIQRLFRNRDARELFMCPLDANDANALRVCLANLEPLLGSVVARGRPASGLETEAVELAFVAARLLGERELWHRYGALLGQASPVSVEYARGVCRGDVPDVADLTTRLRADYPGSFVAGHLAAVLEARRGNSCDAVSAAAVALAPLAVEPEHREQLAGLLLETAMHEEGVQPLERARDDVGRLLPPDHRLLQRAACELLYRAGRTEDAEAHLVAGRDEEDPLWLQQAAAFEVRRGARTAALGHLIRAARMLGRRETCQQAFCLANDLGDAAAMRELLGLLARITPEDPTVPRNLAVVEFRAGHFRLAAEALRRVERLAPGTAGTSLFLAQALALAGQGEEAVQILNRACGTHPGVSGLHQLRALVLDSLGRPIPAFEGLHAARERFWSEMSFVQLYHSLAYKANREAEAHLAFLRMQELQNGDPDGPLHAGTIDDLREFADRARRRHDEFNRQLLLGRLPWPMVGRALGREAYIDWAIRTQDTFVPDDPLARAEYSVYATHGFAVRTDGSAPPALVPITACTPGQAVVADLSALLTLHSLGLLDRALAHTGRVVVPAGYIARFLEDHRSLQPHQPSEIEARRAILTAVDEGRLRLAPAGSVGVPCLPVFDEYHPDEKPADYHLADAVDYLHQTGRLTGSEVERLRPVCRQSKGPAAADFQTAAHQGVCVRVGTLVTVHKSGLLDRFLGAIRLHVEQREVEELRQELLGTERRAEIARWSRELHAILTGDERVESTDPVRPDEGNTGTAAVREHDPLTDAFLLAEQLQLPLLADDRCLQTVLLNARHGQPGAAFGTASLLASLADAGTIDAGQHATAWLQLARWRCRFLAPPPGVLLTLALRHPQFPPGEELRAVARYLHDCALDLGLLCGPEPTEPPVPIGLRYFQEVVASIGQFLMRVWHDGRFNERAATALTHWVASELIPPPPRPLPYSAYVVASTATSRSVLLSAMTDPLTFRDVPRSNRALVAIAGALGIHQDEYDETIIALIESDLTTSTDAEERAADRNYRQLIATTALQHRDGLGFRAAAVLADLELHPPLDRDIGPPEVDALRDLAQTETTGLPAGPWAFLAGVGGERRNVARYVPDLIFHPWASVRQAAVVRLSAVPPPGECWLTPGTAATLEATSREISGEDTTAARAAAATLERALSRDFLLALARFRQVRLARLEGDGADALAGVLEPRSGVLQSVPPCWYGLPADEWDQVHREAMEAPTLAATLDTYYERYGHLPLASARAVESIVRDWLAAHGGTGSWGDVLAWAQDDCRPLKRYHACRIFLGNPSLVPTDAHSAAWGAVTELLDGFPTDPESPTLVSQSWSLLHALSRHYLQLLEVDSPDRDATALSALAWWAAERATHTLATAALAGTNAGEAARIVRRLVQGGVQPRVSLSSVSRTIGRPIRPASPLSYGTLHVNSLWRPALLETPPGEGLTLVPERAEAVIEMLALGLGTGFPARDGGPSAPTLAIEIPLSTVAERWFALLPDGSPPVETTPEPAVDPAPASIAVALRTVGELEEDAGFLVLQQLRTAVALGTLDVGEIRWLLEDRAWWDRAFGHFPEHTLDVFWSLVDYLLRTGTEEWALAVPHLFRQQALRPDLPADRRWCAVAAVVQSCLITGNVSAIRLLVRDAAAPDLRDSLVGWKQRLAAIRLIAPPPVQARIRTVLALLPSVDEPPREVHRQDTDSPAAGNSGPHCDPGA